MITHKHAYTEAALTHAIHAHTENSQLDLNLITIFLYMFIIF